MPNYPDVQLFIDGKWREGAEGKTLPIIDPATEVEIGRLAHATRPDLDAALKAAEKGFEIWRNTSVFERYQIMRKAAQLLRERKDDIAWLMTRDQGKPLAQSAMEIAVGADTIDWFAEEARRTYGQVIPARAPGVTQMTMKLPVGVVAAFTPWNFPVNQIVRKLSAALATGCSIIVKAPEETPASPAELIRVFQDAGVPDGVVNLVYGIPAEISEYLIPHPTVRKISFTGSTPVGKHLAALAGGHMKRATMELGGHAPVLVFDDADVDNAINVMASTKLRNAGQVCVSPTRFLVQENAAEKFIDGFVAAMESATVGNGLDPETEMGPLANERRIPAMEAMIADAKSKGADVITGGERIGNQGYFFQPTVLRNVSPNTTAMNDEPFGPMALINTFKTYDEAVHEANRLPYGLAAYAFTSSAETLQKLSCEVESGMLTVNHVGLALPEVPFGGIQDSGYGTEGGSDAVEPYLETRFVTALTS
ncbi:MAG: NAD-dependent succinate-semialdehyde dehydrogenase [Alphaproteobacteria bacterium]|nr:NAD-dependent succinate-semialdehyde dehydrogenase [Alphaproteobacteria bacterium]